MTVKLSITITDPEIYWILDQRNCISDAFQNAFCDRGYHSYQNRIVHKEKKKKDQEKNNKVDSQALVLLKG